MKILGIIPARYNSTRFPGKPLVVINGKTMIEHVWNGVNNTGLVDHVVVATEDKRIMETVAGFGGDVDELIGRARGIRHVHQGILRGHGRPFAFSSPTSRLRPSPLH